MLETTNLVTNGESLPMIMGGTLGGLTGTTLGSGVSYLFGVPFGIESACFMGTFGFGGMNAGMGIGHQMYKSKLNQN